MDEWDSELVHMKGERTNVEFKAFARDRIQKLECDYTMFGKFTPKQWKEYRNLKAKLKDCW